MARTKKPIAPVCKWTPDGGVTGDADYWTTDCGEAFTFITDGPQENSMRFCCYCGKKLKVADVEG